jgi:hypothetical protein
MRAVLTVAIVVGAVVAVATPAFADGLVIPAPNPTPYAAYASQAIERPWDNQQPQAQLHEQPIGQLIATKLGFGEGSAELFRYHMENSSSEHAQLDGLIDGGGIRLKLSW